MRSSTGWPARRLAGRELVLVSSGAIAAGLGAARPAAPALATWPPSRRRPAWARGCWCTAIPSRSPGTV